MLQVPGCPAPIPRLPVQGRAPDVAAFRLDRFQKGHDPLDIPGVGLREDDSILWAAFQPTSQDMILCQSHGLSGGHPVLMQA